MRCQLKRLVFLRVCREGGYSFGDSQQAPLNYLWLAERRLALEVGSGQHAQPLRGAPRLLPGLISPQRAVRCGSFLAPGPLLQAAAAALASTGQGLLL